MADLTREALIEAAERAFVAAANTWPITDELWAKVKREMPDGTVHRRDIQLTLDAVLGLIADAIEAAGQSQYREGLIDGHWRAARLVRSLGGGQ